MKEIFIAGVDIPAERIWDDRTERFYVRTPIKTKDTILQLEHSLISLQKWEQKWHKPFLGKKGVPDDKKTMEEIIDYIRCMTINKVDPAVYAVLALNTDLVKEIVDYIKDPMTASWFNDGLIGAQSKNSTESITAETIYYWMISLNIPSEYKKWHLNSLLSLIKLVNLKNQPDKKMSSKEAAAQRRALNAARRAKMKSKG